jgi:hypothetical protein
MMTYLRNGRKSARIQVGEVVYVQDGLGPFGPRQFWRPVRKDPYIVESFANREYAQYAGGQYRTVYIRGGHLVTLRSLRTGRRIQVADWLVEMSAELAA